MPTTDRAQSVFLNALEISAEDVRLAYLDAECRDSSELRRDVEELLKHAERMGGFLEHDPTTDGAADLPRTVDTPVSGTIHGPVTTKLAPGHQIGPYKIREQIAEGGMGAVYVAEQSKPVRRKVALKVIRPGMAGPNVVARFEAERQALAMMDHPNIARVLDGGSTEDALPYFVMELVQGLPITEYSDQKRLTTRQRLELMVDICRAVQHAHQKGIIHRDLKPSNILVAEIDGKAVPKVIDFGVAKALHQRLTDQTVYTQFSQIVGTPLYMSPEQAGMGVVDVDTRSDVYSLGVVLYELLTGDTPFDRERFKIATFDEMRRIIREEEPMRPSAMVSTLKAEAQSTLAEHRGIDARKLRDTISSDLDWLVMKALEKDRGRRYESASDLAADIKRYLGDEPVLACPPSIGYRFKKLVRRNRDRVIVGTIVGLAILFAAVFTINAKLEQSRDTRQLVADVQSSITTAKAALDSRDLAGAERWVAQARGRLGDNNQAELKTLINQIDADLKTHQQQYKRFHRFRELAHGVLVVESQETLQNKSEDLLELLEALNLYSILDDDEWYKRLQQSYLTAQEQNEVKETAYQLLLVWADNNVRWTRGRNAKSAAKSLDFLRRAELFHEPTRAFYFVRSECYKYLEDEENKKRDLKAFNEAEAVSAFDHFLPAHTACWRGRKEEAIDGYRAALMVEPDHYASLFFLAFSQHETNPRSAAEIYRACLALRPTHSAALTNRGILLSMQGDYEESIDALKKAIELFPDEARHYYDLFVVYHKLSEFDNALTQINQAIELAPDNSRYLMARADCLSQLGRYEDSLRELDQAADSGFDSPDLDYIRGVVHLTRAVKVHAKSGHTKENFSDLTLAYELIASSWKEATIRNDTSNWAGAAESNFAYLLATSSDVSLQDPSRAVELATAAVRREPENAWYLHTLGAAQYSNGQFDQAVESLNRSLELDEELFAECSIFLAMTHHKLGNKDKARQYYERATDWRDEHELEPRVEQFYREAEQLFEQKQR